MTDQQEWEWDVDADAAAGAGVATGVGRPLSSPGKRLGAHLLDIALAIVTLYVGWAVWSVLIWKDGKTPAKQLLGMRVIEEYDGRPANWWTMAIREAFAKPLCAVPIVLTAGVLLFMPLWSPKRQELWDRLAGTVVINEKG